MTDIQSIPSSQILIQSPSHAIPILPQNDQSESDSEKGKPSKTSALNFSNNSALAVNTLQSQIIEFEIREEFDRQQDQKPKSKKGVINSPIDPEETNSKDVDENKDQPGKLSKSEKKQVRKLQARDQEVKNHENAHLAAAGGHAAGGPVYTYQTGPDGKQYAVGGHVNIDTNTEPTPEETITKMQAVIAAAGAPTEPSSQDMSVAAKAMSKLAEARHELTVEKAEESSDRTDDGEEDVGRENGSEDSHRKMRDFGEE